MQAFNIIAVLAGLTAAICWGVSDFLAANVSRKINSLLVTIFVMIFTAISFSLVYLLALDHQHAWVTNGVILDAMAGLLMTIAITAFYRGLSMGTVSIVSPIGAAYPLVTTLLVIAIFHTRLLPYQAFGIVLTVVGIMVTAGLLAIKRRDVKLDAGFLFAIVACIAWGTMFALLGKAVELLGWEKGSLVEVWFMVVGCVAILPFIKMSDVFGKDGLNALRNKYVVGVALLQTTGVVVLNYGFIHATSTAIETTISACYPILTVILALIFFKEKISPITKIGIVATILGVATISNH